MASPFKVHILEDTPNAALLTVHELEEAGYDLDWECVEKEKDYIKGIAKHPDLILADLTLPDEQGEEILMKLREENITEDIPVIIVSNKDTGPDKCANLSFHADSIWSKSTLDRSSLMAHVEDGLTD